MEKKTTYWQENLRLIAICLVIWFIVSFGFGLLLVEPLNEFRLGGYKLAILVCSARFNLYFCWFDFLV